MPARPVVAIGVKLAIGACKEYAAFLARFPRDNSARAFVGKLACGKEPYTLTNRYRFRTEDAALLLIRVRVEDDLREGLIYARRFGLWYGRVCGQVAGVTPATIGGCANFVRLERLRVGVPQ